MLYIPLSFGILCGEFVKIGNNSWKCVLTVAAHEVCNSCASSQLISFLSQQQKFEDFLPW